MVDGETILFCAYCKTNEAKHRDHVIPRSRGGADENENCLMACPDCNQKKSDKLPSEWMPEGLAVEIYALESRLKTKYKMKSRSQRGTSHRRRLRGHYALIFEGRDLHYQVRILGHERNGWYLVQYYSAIDGSPTNRAILHIDKMNEWKFYESIDAWHDAYRFHYERSKYAPQLKYDDLGVPQWPTICDNGKAVVKGSNPFEVSLETELRELEDRDSLIRVHDDYYIARTIAVSIFGHSWESHVTDVLDRIRLSIGRK